MDNMIRHNFEKAFTDVMVLKLKDGDWVYLLDLIKEIKQRLYALVPNNLRIHAKIDEDIPVELIGQMIEHQAIKVSDFRGYFSVIVEWIAKMCAPCDDKQVNEVLQNILTCEIVDFATTIPPLILQINKLIDTIVERSKTVKEKLNNLPR